MQTSQESFSVRVPQNIIQGSNYRVKIALRFFWRVSKHFAGFVTKKSVDVIPLNWRFSDFAMHLKLVLQCSIFAKWLYFSVRRHVVLSFVNTMMRECLLNHFKPILLFYTPGKHKETSAFKLIRDHLDSF